MQTILLILHNVLHFDAVLMNIVARYGVWTYVFLFALIFIETGFVIFPFLPGDSLLFTAGTIAANSQQALRIQLLFLMLVLASILGNKLNYTLGRYFGPRIFAFKKSWLFNPKHLHEAQAFYQKHGGKTIIFARFLPIIRSFAPFVAGIGTMNLGLFSFYNVVSALIWVGSILFAGYFFGTLPWVQAHFSAVLYGIIGISLLPALASLVFSKKS